MVELGHRIVWYISGYECLGGAIWFCLHRLSDDGSSRSRPNHIFHIFIYCVTLLQKPYIHVRQYTALLFYIILWSKQKCVTGNIIKSLTSVCSCFVKILMFNIFSTILNGCGYCMAGGFFYLRSAT